MPDEINFIDLAALTRITPDAVVEKFGGVINSSFFDASSILATLKQKGLIDFTTAFPGQSAITITELGKQLLNDAHDKANTPFDPLDFTILTQLSAGKRNVHELNQSVNVTQKDFALRIYKLAQNSYLSYDMRNGNISISLTEKGFLQVKTGMPQPGTGTNNAAQTAPPEQQMAQPIPQPNPQAAPQMPAGAQPTAPGQAATPEKTIAEIEKNINQGKRQTKIYIIGLVILVLLMAVAYGLFSLKLI